MRNASRARNMRNSASPGRMSIGQTSTGSKRNKVIPGHAMPIRDRDVGGRVRHKLEDYKGITRKEFGINKKGEVSTKE